jgi:hypothetical protein
MATSPDQVRDPPLRIADDPRRLGAMIDGMADYLDQALRLHDPAMRRDDLHWKRDAGLAIIEKSRADTLGSTLYEEARYMPDTAQLDYLEALDDVAEKAERAEKLAIALTHVCDKFEDNWESVSETGAIALAPYASWWAYYHFTEIDATCGLVVGGMGRMLRDRITLLAEDWLHECDRLLCLVHGRQNYGSGNDIATLVHKLAKDIAKRVTLHNATSPFAEMDNLEPDSLGARNEMEFTRVRVNAQCQARNDMRALKALLVLVREPMSLQAKTIFDSQLPLLQMIVDRPPSELGLVGENARRMNLPLLQRCLVPGMDTTCRMHIAIGWANRHGAWAQTAIAEAIRRLEGFSPREHSNFIQVVTRSSLRGGATMPAMPWAPWADAWFVIPPPSGPATRTGLDEAGERVVRLASFAWQLVGAGAFEQGVMHASVVSEVSVECLQLARLGRELIDNERRRCCVGVRLLSFNQSINDRSSELSSALDKAQCALSHFSLRDICDVFHPKKPLLERIYMELTRRTRTRLGNKRSPLVPVNYDTFVGDALALLLPAVEARRLQIDLPQTVAPHPLGDMLRTVCKCREWTPLNGKCRLDLDDLRGAHPGLRQALEHYVKAGNDFVIASHLRPVDIVCANSGLGGPTCERTWMPAKARVSFEFESAPLLQLLKM